MKKKLLMSQYKNRISKHAKRKTIMKYIQYKIINLSN